MKKRRRYSTKRRVPSRRWHVPPPLIHGPETLEGGEILQEWGSGLGVTLWQAFRDCVLWATSPAESRTEAFVSLGTPETRGNPKIAADPDPRLEAGLELLRRMVEMPGSIREEQVAHACRQISEWADDKGRLGTALAFAQSAALALARDAAAAFWVATIAVRLNDHARAEVWFRRAIGLARQSRDWRMYSRSFSGLGNLYIRRGNLPAARRLHTRALRGARRGGMRREQAAALHDLFAVAVETGSADEAECFARQALEAYGTRNRKVHVLAHDVAYFWMEQGHFARALPVFQAVLPLMQRPIERLFVFADIARAAGGVGNRCIAETAATEVWNATIEPDLEPGAARALLEVARGYVSLDQSEQARSAAERALALASEHRESRVRFAAEALIDSLGTRPDVSADEFLPTYLATPDGDSGDQLAADLVRTLEVIAGETP